MKTWVISDTHLYHTRMTELCGRPDDFTEQIVINWNNMVGPNDVVYHLGDVGFYKKSGFSDVIQGLPGHKILIRGNHDNFPVGWYLDHGFMSVMDYAVVNVRLQRGVKRVRNEYYRVLLSHFPLVIMGGVPNIKKSGVYGRVDYNVHGHFHNNPAERWEPSLTSVVTEKHKLFSIEELGYKPVELSEALKQNLLINTWSRLQESV